MTARRVFVALSLALLLWLTGVWLRQVSLPLAQFERICTYEALGLLPSRVPVRVSMHHGPLARLGRVHAARIELRVEGQPPRLARCWLAPAGKMQAAWADR